MKEGLVSPLRVQRESTLVQDDVTYISDEVCCKQGDIALNPADG